MNWFYYALIAWVVLGFIWSFISVGQRQTPSTWFDTLMTLPVFVILAALAGIMTALGMKR